MEIKKNKPKALFLDRDGVINLDKGHVYKIEDFEFINNIFKVCLYFQQQGYLIIIITNQAGIAKGYYNHHDFNKLNRWMLNEFLKQKINITKVYYCPHHPMFSNCECRKPKPGMIINAKNEFNLDLENSYLIGDKESDIQAGKKAGIKNLKIIKKDSCIDLKSL